MRSASRLADIAPFHVMELLTRAKQLEAAGRDIIHMEVGEPDFPTPATIVEAAQRAIAGGRMFYTPALGLPELREAISRFYVERYQVAVPASRIVVTAGASGALTLALACLVEPGSEWLLTDPGYPCFIDRHDPDVNWRDCPHPITFFLTVESRSERQSAISLLH